MALTPEFTALAEKLQEAHESKGDLRAILEASDFVPKAPAPVRLVESAVALPSEFRFEEAAAMNPLAKIISPGRGTTGYYSADVLKRDGPQIFKPGTLMYINHATPQEEAARPEGDWNKLAAVTVGTAYWDENGRDGPALYAPTKVFSDFAQQVKEKAPYTGLSIRAMGERDDKNKAPDGKPGIVTALTHAESIDLVTKAGRGGKLLTEAATAIQQFSEGENPMDESRVLALIKEATGPLVVENSRLKSQLARIGAPTAIREALGTVRLPDASKDLIVNRLASAVPFTEAGEIDTAKLKTMVEAEALAEANYLKSLGVGGVHGMGTASTVEMTEAQRTEETKKMREHVDRIARNLFGVKTDAGAKVFAEGRAAFDPNYNTATKAGGILHGVALEG